MLLQEGQRLLPQLRAGGDAQTQHLGFGGRPDTVEAEDRQALAVHTAIVELWSNLQTEGQINRLKMDES